MTRTALPDTTGVVPTAPQETAALSDLAHVTADATLGRVLAVTGRVLAAAHGTRPAGDRT